MTERVLTIAPDRSLRDAAQFMTEHNVGAAVVDDIILGTKDDKIDGLIIDANGKKMGVRITAAKIETKDGKTTITLPLVTAEMLKSSVPAFGAKK